VVKSARYRQKDEVDLRWNRIRRRITRELDLQIADWREEALNTLLSDAFRQYAKSLQTGEVLELEARYDSFVKTVLDEVIDVTVDAPA
jgi:hypothetical protein